MFSGMAFPWWKCSITKLAKKNNQKHKSDEAPIFNSHNVSWCFFCYFSWVVEALGRCVLRIPGRLTWQCRNNRLKFKDVSPIKHGDFPASHVSFRVCTGRNVFFPHEERPLMSDWTSDSRLPTINHPQPSTVGSMIFRASYSLMIWAGSATINIHTKMHTTIHILPISYL